MKKILESVPPDVNSLITEVRGHKVILDADLARVYGVPTKVLNQAVKRNNERFPQDFLLRLTIAEAAEMQVLRSQIVTSNEKRGGRRYLPYAFTEHGALMAANILNSPRAVAMSVYVIRAFVKMRETLLLMPPSLSAWPRLIKPCSCTMPLCGRFTKSSVRCWSRHLRPQNPKSVSTSKKM